jgi:hypothetical protein
MPSILASATRGFLLQPALAETIGQFLHDIVQRYVAGPQDDQQMVEYICGLSRQMSYIILHCSENEFDSFFTELAGAFLPPS